MDEVKIRREDLSGGPTHFIFKGKPQDGLDRESKRVIRQIMTALEEHTNFDELDPKIKKVVRGVVLDNINSMKRTALLYLEVGGKS